MNEILTNNTHIKGKVVKCAKCLNIIKSGKCYCFTTGSKYCIECGKQKDNKNICRNRSCANFGN